jgi:hypothetical protein
MCDITYTYTLSTKFQAFVTTGDTAVYIHESLASVGATLPQQPARTVGRATSKAKTWEPVHSRCQRGPVTHGIGEESAAFYPSDS